MVEKLTEIGELNLPYRRQARLREVEFDGGMKMVRLVLLEGRRITQVDLDSESARRLGALLSEAAGRL